jgi:hypothetical protein
MLIHHVQLIIDRVGRKPMLLVGSVVMGVCMVTVGVIVAKFSHDWPHHVAAGWTAVALIWVYIAGFGATWGPVRYVFAKVQMSQVKVCQVAVRTFCPNRLTLHLHSTAEHCHWSQRTHCSWSLSRSVLTVALWCDRWKRCGLLRSCGGVPYFP